MARSGDLAVREEMVETCRRMNATGINQGTAGNLSIRCEDGVLITPSSLPYERMEPADLVVLRPDGSVEGAHRPSSEWRFHRDILAARADVLVVLHCHSLNATALAVHCHGIPAFHYMVAVAGGPTIRCSRYATFGTQELSDAALEALEGRTACLLGHHGQISLGRSFEAALGLAVEVETLAAMYVAARSLGEPPVLPDDEIARVRAKMLEMSYAGA
jgi:L-fuculose-phosphate aldolase